MAMKSSSITLSLLITCHFLSLTSNCSLLQIDNQIGNQIDDRIDDIATTTHMRGLLFDEKTRLGSRPPSCHNKCNMCHPCMAVQVPTLPGHSRVKPGSGRVKKRDYNDEAPSGNMHSNYKPLGWKCRCGGHLYNP